jgi:hypothetical protein
MGLRMGMDRNASHLSLRERSNFRNNNGINGVSKLANFVRGCTVSGSSRIKPCHADCPFLCRTMLHSS